MATCVKCNKKSIFLDVAKNGECVECSEETAKEMLKNNMSISKIIIQKSDDYPQKCIGIAVDEQNKKLAISGVNTKDNNAFFDFKIYDFEKVVSVDIVENGNSAISGNVGATIAGGLLFGGIGAIAGASKGKKIKKICNSLSIEIYFDDLYNPVRKLDYINKPTKSESRAYKDSIEKIKEAYAILNYVVIQNKKKQDDKEKNKISFVDEIRKYKQLCDDGVITKEEFEAKKKQILEI